MNYYYVLKFAAILMLLFYLRMLNRKSLIIYASSVLFISMAYPQESHNVPELIVLFTSLLLFLCLLTFSINKQLKKFRTHSGFSFFLRNKSAFIRLFVISSALIGLHLQYFQLLILTLPIYALVGYSNKANLGIKQTIESIFSGIFVGLFFSLLILNQQSILIRALSITVFYASFYATYILISSSFVEICDIKKLKPGMLPAETIIKRKEGFFKEESGPLSVIGLLFMGLRNKFSNDELFIAPFKPLSDEQIIILKRISLRSNINTLKIQHTLDLKYFWIMGAIITLLYIASMEYLAF